MGVMLATTRAGGFSKTAHVVGGLRRPNTPLHSPPAGHRGGRTAVIGSLGRPSARTEGGFGVGEFREYPVAEAVQALADRLAGCAD